MNRNSKWQVRLASFMRGRYGYFDTLGKHMLYAALGLVIVNIFLKNGIVSLLSLLLLGVTYYRLFSKKIYVRTNENQKYQKWLNKLTKPFKGSKAPVKNRKEFRYYKCKSCRQEIRVPRNRGKIRITCPKCQEQFIKKT